MDLFKWLKPSAKNDNKQESLRNAASEINQKEREELGQRLKAKLREIQENCILTDEEYGKKPHFTQMEKPTKLRGDGSIQGLLRYIDFLEKRLLNVSTYDIEKSLTDERSIGYLERTHHLSTGEKIDESMEYGWLTLF